MGNLIEAASKPPDAQRAGGIVYEEQPDASLKRKEEGRTAGTPTKRRQICVELIETSEITEVLLAEAPVAITSENKKSAKETSIILQIRTGNIMYILNRRAQEVTVPQYHSIATMGRGGFKQLKKDEGYTFKLVSSEDIVNINGQVLSPGGSSEGTEENQTRLRNMLCRNHCKRGSGSANIDATAIIDGGRGRVQGTVPPLG